MKTAKPGPIILRSNAWAMLRDHVLITLYGYLTRRALPLFVRGCDIISAGPMVVGRHEPQVAAAIEGFAADGYSGFLIDVGANIGLTSCISGQHFKSLVMFEPNPLCLGVLQSNCAIALGERPREIRPYGLGMRSEQLTLRVPLKNWGGAYVVTADNAYDKQTLLTKDGFETEDAANYRTVSIQIESAELTFQDLFAQLDQAGQSKGTIKIDVEGLELVILRAIAKTLPSGLEVAIIFEHWGGEFSGEALVALFAGRAELLALEKAPTGARTRLGKLLDLLLSGAQTFTKQPWRRGSTATDLVLIVKSNAAKS